MKNLFTFFYRENYCKLTYLLLVIYAFQSIAGGLSYYITLFLRASTSLSVLKIAAIVSFTYAGNTIGSIVSGYLSDKVNPCYLMKTGLLIQGVSLLSLIFVSSSIYFYPVMFFMGFGSLMYVASTNYILTARYGRYSAHRKLITSDQAIFSNIGMLVGSFLIGFAAAGYYPYIFAFISIMLIGVSVLFSVIDKEFYKVKSENKDIKSNFQLFMFLIGIFSVISVGVLFGIHKIGYPIYLHGYHGSIRTGLLMMLNPFIILCFQNKIIETISKYNDHDYIILMIGFALFGISFVVLDASPSVLIVFLACTIFTLGEIIVPTYAFNYVYGYSPAGKEGFVTGLYKAIFSVSRLVGSYIAGGLIHYINVSTLWAFSFLICLISALGVYTLFLKHRGDNPSILS